MEGKNRLVRMIAPLLVIGAIVSLAGIAGAFELKVSGNSQSVPLDSGFSQPNLTVATPGTPVPTAIPSPTATQNITYYNTVSNTAGSQAGMLDKLSVHAEPYGNDKSVYRKQRSRGERDSGIT